MPKQVEKYINERKEIVQKILDILEINEINNKFSLNKIDNDPIKKQQILDLEPEIKKYFICSRWTYFSNKNREFKRTYLSLIKAIFKNMNVKLTTSRFIKFLENNKTSTETYYIVNINQTT